MCFMQRSQVLLKRPWLQIDIFSFQDSLSLWLSFWVDKNDWRATSCGYSCTNRRVGLFSWCKVCSRAATNQWFRGPNQIWWPFFVVIKFKNARKRHQSTDYASGACKTINHKTGLSFSILYIYQFSSVL